MAQLDDKQMSKLQQGLIVILSIGLQILLYYLSFSHSLPYPLFVRGPGGLFFLVFTIVFIASIASGAILGWRHLPLIISCLTGTTLALCLLIPALMIIGSIFSSVAADELTKDLRNVLLIISTEEVVPSAIWALLGGMCGSLLNVLLKPTMGIARQRSRFLLNMSAAVFVTIALFGVASSLATELLVYGGAVIFVGILIGVIVQDKAMVLAGSGQSLLGLGIVAWLILTVRGEGAMAVGSMLIDAVPISIVLVVIGAFYGKYLRNHFLERVTRIDKKERSFLSGERK